MHHVGPIAGVATHGAWVATAGHDNRLILWDAATRQPLARASHDHLVNACDFSVDGRWLVSASSDTSARIWSLPDLRLHAVLAGHGDDVDLARFSPDNRRVATCALDRVVRVYDAAGACLQAMTGHTGDVLSLAWIDARRFVTTSVDGTLREWDAIDGVLLRTIAIGIRSDCVEIAATGAIFAGDDQGRIVVIDSRGVAASVEAHDAGIKTLVMSRDGGRLVTLGHDRMIAVWQVSGAEAPVEIARSALPPAIWARAAAVCPDGRIAVGTFGGAYALFDPHSGAWDLDGVAAGPGVNAIAEVAEAICTIGDAGVLRVDGEVAGGPGSLCNFLAAAEGRLFTGGLLGALCDARTGAVFHRHHSPLACATVLQRSGFAHLVVGACTGEVLVFTLTGGLVRLARTLRPHGNAVTGLAARDGVLFSVAADGDIAWHDTGDWRELRRVPNAHDRIANACVALGGGAFASAGHDRMLRLWLPEGERALPTPHPNSVKCLAASPCGRWIASGSHGGTVAVFDRMDERFSPIQRPSQPGIAALCWSRHSQGFLAASCDGQIHDIAIAAAMATTPPMRAVA